MAAVVVHHPHLGPVIEVVVRRARARSCEEFVWQDNPNAISPLRPGNTAPAGAASPSHPATADTMMVWTLVWR